MYLPYVCFRLVFFVVLGSLALPALAKSSTTPPLALAQSYHPGINLKDYWVSEKYDGMRAYWDGKTLW